MKRHREASEERPRFRLRPYPVSPSLRSNPRRSLQLSGVQFLHGNFDQYRTWCPWNSPSNLLSSVVLDDPRVQALSFHSGVRSLFEGAKVLDIGCGGGYVGASLLRAFPKLQTYTGIDIDGGLITRARSVLEWAIADHRRSPADNEGKGALEKAYLSRGLDPTMAPSSFRLKRPAPPPESLSSLQPGKCEPLFIFRTEDFLSDAPVATGVSSAVNASIKRTTSTSKASERKGRARELNANISVATSSLVSSVLSSALKIPPPIWDTELRSHEPNPSASHTVTSPQQQQQPLPPPSSAAPPTSAFHAPGSYTIILCLKLTKWVHLTRGDKGILLLFRRIYQLLAPGGVLIFQPNRWEGYHASERLLGSHTSTEALSRGHAALPPPQSVESFGRHPPMGSDGASTSSPIKQKHPGRRPRRREYEDGSARGENGSPSLTYAPSTLKFRPDAFLAHLLGRVGFTTLETTLWIPRVSRKGGAIKPPSPVYVLLKR